MAHKISIDDAMSLLGFGKFQHLMMVTSGIGYAVDVIELLMLVFVAPILEIEWGLSKVQRGLLFSISSLGILVGALSWGKLADTIGRRTTFLSSVMFLSIGGVLTCLCHGYITFCICRFIVGFGLGGNLSIDFALFVEFIPPKGRGVPSMLLTGYGILGLMYVSLTGMYIIPMFGWRIYAMLCAIPSASLPLLRFKIHESPRYLYSRGDSKAALQVIKDVAITNGVSFDVDTILIEPMEVLSGCSSSSSSCGGGSYGNDDILVLLENNSFNSNNNSNNKKNKNGGEESLLEDHKDMSYIKNTSGIFSKQLRKSTVLLWILWFLLSFSYSGITTWLPHFLQERGASTKQVYTSYLLTALTEIPGLLLATALVKYGRVKLFSIVLVMTALFTYCFRISEHVLVAKITSCLVYGFSVQCWSVLYIYTAEVYPTSVRSTGSGLTRMFSCIGSTLSPIVGALLIDFVSGIDDDGITTSKNTQLLRLLHPLNVFSFILIIAGIAAWNLPIETANRKLCDFIEEIKL